MEYRNLKRKVLKLILCKTLEILPLYSYIIKQYDLQGGVLK